MPTCSADARRRSISLASTPTSSVSTAATLRTAAACDERFALIGRMYDPGCCDPADRRSCRVPARRAVSMIATPRFRRARKTTVYRRAGRSHARPMPTDVVTLRPGR